MEWFLLFLGFLALVKSLVSLRESLHYKNLLTKTTFKNHWTPHVTVIVPCKGTDPGFEDNINSILQQNYPKVNFIFVTESSNDQAYKVLHDLIQSVKNPENVKLVVAGIANNASQKIHNLTCAIQYVSSLTEVVVFADSDIRPHPYWLRNLVTPLQDKKIGVSTGYRWYVPRKGNFWSAIRSVWNMTSANLLFNPKYNFAWGGSMAIRKKIFDELQITQKWRNGLSDDLILTNTIKKAGYQIQFVPQAMVITDECTSLQELTNWITRQMIIVRMYTSQLWIYAAFSHWIFQLIFWFGIILLLKNWLLHQVIPLGVWLMLSDGPFGTLINFTRFKGFKDILKKYPVSKEKLPLWPYLFLHPFSAMVMNWALVKSSLTNQIIWRGIRYRLIGSNKIMVIRNDF